jgi:hypothetical protein
MTPKEKAHQLYNKMVVDFSIDHWQTKQCTLVVVDEIIKSNELDYFMTKDEIDSLEVTSDDLWLNEKFNKYWKEVKKEIEKL